MYSQHMNRINRSPDGGEGNGGAPAEEVPASGPAGDSTPPAGKAPEYLSKSDFETFQNEFRQTIQRLTPREQAREDAKTPTEAKRPNPADFDFQKDPKALEKYEDAMDEFRYQTRKTKEAGENAGREAEQRAQNNAQDHDSRVEAYRKENPDFAEALKAAGNIMVDESVKQAVFGSKNSHIALHYIAKNPDAARELNAIARSGDAADVRERVGEMVTEMKAQAKQADDNEKAASIRPPRQTFRGGASTGKRTFSDAERFERFSQG